MFVIGLFLLMSALSVAVWQGFLQKRKIEGVDWRSGHFTGAVTFACQQ